MGPRRPDSIEGILEIAKSEGLIWSDNIDVVWWVHGRSRKFKPFVTNRLSEIQSLTNPEQRRHVPTKQNPADLLKRGLSVSALIEEDRWWKSLAFLEKKETEWRL